MVNLLLKYLSISAAVWVASYAGLLVCLHRIEMTWFKNFEFPETFGFMRNQVTPFFIESSDGERLYAWHILPIELYRKHELALMAEPSVLVSDITSRLAFKLLRDDPDARLILHINGAAGTVESGYRVSNYRALSAGQPKKIHVLTFDYRGFGHSTGTPSERGILLDAIAVVDWATKVAGIPPSRILIFGQSLGTAVSIAISEHFALQSPPVVFTGTILVAPFVDVATPMATYSVGRTFPILSLLFNYLGTFVQDKWLSKDRIAKYIQANEANGEKYQLTLIHAKDDYDIPWHHITAVFWHAVNATVPGGISYDKLEERKYKSMIDLGAAGSVIEWRTETASLGRRY